MGGFSLFEKISELEHLACVPFIFLAALSDDILIRKAKELGADDYLTKPVCERDLIAAIRGKLKYFEQVSESGTGRSQVLRCGNIAARS